MTIFPIPAFTDNYIWLLTGENKTSAVCVDPGQSSPVIDFLEGNQLKLEAILLTHHHWDHSGGILELLKYDPSIKVYGPKDDRLSDIPNLITDQEHLTVLNYNFKVLSIPGHTSTHICFYEPTHGLVFCGDTLFSAGCGRVFDGTIEQLHSSLAKLAALPEDTKVYCGHEYTRQNLRFAASVEPGNVAIQTHYHALMNSPEQCSLPSTIGLEKLINPFLRVNEAEVKDYAVKQGIKLDDLSIFKQLRADKNDFA